MKLMFQFQTSRRGGSKKRKKEAISQQKKKKEIEKKKENYNTNLFIPGLRFWANIWTGR
jgi:hypothetical protein